MTQPQRELLLTALLGSMDASAVPGIEQMLTADIDTIEPLVDEMVRNAEARGRFRGILEGGNHERR